MKTLLITIVLMVCSHISAQKYTYIGPNMSILNPWINRSGEYGNYLEVSGGYGFSIRRTLNDLISLESGFYSLHLNDIAEYGFSGRQTVWWGDSYLFPIRVQISKYIFKKRISVYGYFGPEYCYNNGSIAWSRIQHLNANKDHIFLEGLTIDPHNVFLALGSGIRFKLIEEMTFSINLGYGKSFKEVRSYYLEYWIGDELVNSKIFTSRGDYWGLTIRLSYPINKAIKDFKNGLEELQNSEI